MAGNPKAEIEINAVDKTKAAFDSIKSSILGMQNSASALNGVFSSMAPLVGAASFTALIKNAIDAGDAMNDLSKRTGVSVEQLSGWKLAAESSGTSMEALAGAMNKAGRFMVEHNDQLIKMGINASTAEDVIIQLSGVLSKMPADDPRRAALAMDVLGKSAGELLPLLSEGEEGLRRFVDRGKELSVMTAEFARKSDEFNDKLVETGILLENVGISIADVFLGALNKGLPVLNETILGVERLTGALLEEGKAWVGLGNFMEANKKWRSYAFNGQVSEAISEEQHQRNITEIQAKEQQKRLDQFKSAWDKQKGIDEKEKKNALTVQQMFEDELLRIQKQAAKESEEVKKEREALDKSRNEVLKELMDDAAKRQLSSFDYERLQAYKWAQEKIEIVRGNADLIAAINGELAQRLIDLDNKETEEYLANSQDRVKAEQDAAAAISAAKESSKYVTNRDVNGNYTIFDTNSATDQWMRGEVDIFGHPTQQSANTFTPSPVVNTMAAQYNDQFNFPQPVSGAGIQNSGPSSINIQSINLPGITNPQQFIEQLKQMLRADPNLLGNGLSRAF